MTTTDSRFPVGATFWTKERTLGGNFQVKHRFTIVASGPKRITLERADGPLRGDREHRWISTLDKAQDWWAVSR